MIVRIPFMGFYETEYIDYFDLEEEEGVKIDYPATFQNTAKNFAEQWMQDTGFKGVYESLVSPREYNFDTDKVFVDFPEETLEAIKAEVLKDSYAFGDWVSEHCSDRPGFISFLSPYLSDWEEWGEREYYVALLCLEAHELWDEYYILELLRGNGDLIVEGD